MTCPRGLAAAALVMNLVGALLLFRFRLAYRTRVSDSFATHANLEHASLLIGAIRSSAPKKTTSPARYGERVPRRSGLFGRLFVASLALFA